MLNCIDQKYFVKDVRNYYIEISYRLPEKINNKDAFVVISVYDTYVSAYIKCGSSNWFYYDFKKKDFANVYYKCKEKNIIFNMPVKLMKLLILHSCIIHTEHCGKTNKQQSPQMMKIIGDLVKDIFENKK